MSSWSISSPNLQSHKHTHKETDRIENSKQCLYELIFIYIGYRIYPRKTDEKPCTTNAANQLFKKNSESQRGRRQLKEMEIIVYHVTSFLIANFDTYSTSFDTLGYGQWYNRIHIISLISWVLCLSLKWRLPSVLQNMVR